MKQVQMYKNKIKKLSWNRKTLENRLENIF